LSRSSPALSERDGLRLRETRRRTRRELPQPEQPRHRFELGGHMRPYERGIPDGPTRTLSPFALSAEGRVSTRGGGRRPLDMAAAPVHERRRARRNEHVLALDTSRRPGLLDSSMVVHADQAIPRSAIALEASTSSGTGRGVRRGHSGRVDGRTAHPPRPRMEPARSDPFTGILRVGVHPSRLAAATKPRRRQEPPSQVGLLVPSSQIGCYALLEVTL